VANIIIKQLISFVREKAWSGTQNKNIIIIESPEPKAKLIYGEKISKNILK